MLMASAVRRARELIPKIGVSSCCRLVNEFICCRQTVALSTPNYDTQIVTETLLTRQLARSLRNCEVGGRLGTIGSADVLSSTCSVTRADFNATHRSEKRKGKDLSG